MISVFSMIRLMLKMVKLPRENYTIMTKSLTLQINTILNHLDNLVQNFYLFKKIKTLKLK